MKPNRKPDPPKFTIADRLLATGQRLRVDESVVSATVALTYSAKWWQAVESRRGSRRAR